MVMRLIHSLLNHWPAKILSVVGAIVLWFFVMKEQNPISDVTYTVPVQVQNLSSRYVIEDMPKTVKVHLQGPRNTVLSLNPTTMKAYVDLADVSTGQQNVPIHFTPPSGMAVESIDPDTATITVDDFKVKEMPVEVMQLGKTPDNIAVKNINLVPKVATISGAKHLVNEVAHIMLRVNMTNHTEAFSTSGTLIAVDSSGHEVEGVTVTPHQGQAQLDLEKIRAVKLLQVTPNLVGSVADGYEVKQVTITPAQISVGGKESAIKGLSDIKTIDIPIWGLTSSLEGDYGLVLGDDITANPSRVHIKIDISKKLTGADNAESH
ncbi:MAG: CdaR family protein [Veillonellaceae bacterium]|nr:CdaR family protein [Veillonellaceae bacterium]